MSKRTGLAWLAAAWILLGAGLLLASGLGIPSWVEAQRITVLDKDVASIVVAPSSPTSSELDLSDTLAPDAVEAESLAIIEVRVAASSDDAEESATGRMSITSSDLEMVYAGNDQTVGMRFNGIELPQGTAVVNAYLQFQVDETSSEATSLTIGGQDADNATTFTASDFDISSRPQTAATVSWSPVPWLTVGEAGPDQRSPNIASVIQEIVDRPGWSSGNSLAIIVTGTGMRVAESYNGDQAGAPLLHVEVDAGQRPVVTISAPPDGANYTAGQVISFSGSATDAEDGDLTVSLSWMSSLDSTIGTGGSFTRSDLSVGTHTITASVTDSNGLTGTDAISITIHDVVYDIVVSPTRLTISEPSESAPFALTLTSSPTDPVLVPLSASNEQCTVSPTSVNLNATNWADGVTATATALDDAIVDGPQSCTILTGPATSDDTNYAGVDPDDVTVMVNDDDTPYIAVAPKSLTISEPSGADSFTLTLNGQPEGTVSIPLSASNGQCAVSPTSVDLDATNWADGVSAIVTAVDDTIIDGPKTCKILTGSASSSDARYDGLDPDNVTVTVLDNDSPGITVFPIHLTVQEPSGSDSFTLLLNSQPLDPVSVPLSASNDECTVTPASVQLHAANWDIGVSATVTAVDDDIFDDTQTCTILTGPTTSDDPAYHGLDPGDVSVAVEDNEWEFQIYLPQVLRAWPPIPGVPALSHVSNADGNGAYDVSWSTAPLATGYVLEESIDHFFSDAREIYTGPAIYHAVTQRGPTRYSYRVKARNVWGDSGWSGVEQVDVVWEAEPNDLALSQANGPLISGLTYYGTFPSGDDDQDYYFFDLPAAHSVALDLRNIPAGHNYDLVLRRADLSQVGYSALPGNRDEQIRTGTLPAGRYYIQVYHYSSGGSSQAYHLDVAYQ